MVARMPERRGLKQLENMTVRKFCLNFMGKYSLWRVLAPSLPRRHCYANICSPQPNIRAHTDQRAPHVSAAVMVGMPCFVKKTKQVTARILRFRNRKASTARVLRKAT